MNTRKKIFGFVLILASIMLVLLLPLIPVKMNREVDFFALNSIEENIALLYFGYPSCNSICPTALMTLNQIYQSYLPQTDKASLSILFVNLIPDATIESSRNFVNGFNKNFKVLTLTEKEMSKAKSTFGLRFSSLQEDGQLFHKGYSYLLKRESDVWRIKYVYVDGAPNSDEVYTDILELTAYQGT